MRKKNIAVPIILFLVFLCYFSTANRYYLPSNLQISGHSISNARVYLGWDSGNGFNARETIEIRGLEITGKSDDKISFKTTIPLPQIHIKGLTLHATDSLSISSAEIESGNGHVTLPIAGARITGNSIVFTNVRSHTARMHPILFTIQALLSLLLSYLVHEFLNLRTRFNQPDWKRTFAFIFFQEKHWIFWILFAAYSCIFSLWLLGQWPGFVTYDSLYCWTQSVTLSFSNWHPYIYSIYLLLLRQLWDSPASVALFQIAATSALAGYIFYFVLKNIRIPAALCVFPFIIGFAVSIPAGWYNISIIKDTPFSLLAVFWAFYLFYISYRRKTGVPVYFSTRKIMLLSFLLIIFCLLRHNGIINLVVLPLMFLFLNSMPRRKFASLIIISVFLYALFHYWIAGLLNVNAGTDYKELKFTAVINPLAALFVSKWYWSDNYDEDKRIIERWMSVEEIRERYHPLGNTFTGSAGSDKFSSLTEKQKDDLLNLFYRRMLQNLPIVASDKLHYFLIEIGFGESLYLCNNELLSPDQGRLWDNPACRFICYFPFAPKSELLHKYQDRLTAASIVYKGILDGSFIYWNAAIALFLLSIVFLLYKWIPSSSIFSAVILAQVVFLFFALTDPDFRFVYYLHLSGYFILPLVILEISHRSTRSPKGSLQDCKVIRGGLPQDIS